MKKNGNPEHHASLSHNAQSHTQSSMRTNFVLARCGHVQKEGEQGIISAARPSHSSPVMPAASLLSCPDRSFSSLSLPTYFNVNRQMTIGKKKRILLCVTKCLITACRKKNSVSLYVCVCVCLHTQQIDKWLRHWRSDYQGVTGRLLTHWAMRGRSEMSLWRAARVG